MKRGFPGDSLVKTLPAKCRRCRGPGFDFWDGKIPWRRTWQLTPVFLSRKPYEQRNLVGYSLWGHRVARDWARTSTVSMPLWTCCFQIHGRGAPSEGPFSFNSFLVNPSLRSRQLKSIFWLFTTPSSIAVSSFSTLSSKLLQVVLLINVLLWYIRVISFPDSDVWVLTTCNWPLKPMQQNFKSLF